MRHPIGQEVVMVADNWLDVASALMVLFTMTAVFIYAVLSAQPGPVPTPEDLTKGNGDAGDPAGFAIALGLDFGGDFL